MTLLSFVALMGVLMVGAMSASISGGKFHASGLSNHGLLHGGHFAGHLGGHQLGGHHLGGHHLGGHHLGGHGYGGHGGHYGHGLKHTHQGVVAPYRNDQRQLAVNAIAKHIGAGAGTAFLYGVPGTGNDFGYNGYANNNRLVY